MNLKNLAIAASLSLAALTISTTPAKAGTCWAWNPSSSRTVQGEYCRVSKRVNANGHTVIDIDSGTVVIWDDNTAEVLHKNIPYQKRWFSWSIDKQGDYQLHGAPGYSFSFRF
ncbi:hypothetical protein [Synechococcus sp. CS-197]|uniref:hypothetical protein n=1 Tax=Synechococcus sp. CS-197 TaxID=2847985 RepID=UPI0001525414|nr:hypothetical protein [Synechococcus sp. CS-197]MCT0250541.1 hypothetical protein [Synechococcus sp. CS-197]CAK23323.1 Hypothetical protein SynWH7803_0897 [Synechococcus sp. WH 7803]